MQYSFELVAVERDFPMMELRSSQIVDNRHLTICAYSVDYICMAPIVRNVTSISWRPFTPLDLICGSAAYSGSQLSEGPTFELRSADEVVGLFVAASISIVSTPAFKYDRIAFNLEEIQEESDCHSLVSIASDSPGGKYDFR